VLLLGGSLAKSHVISVPWVVVKVIVLYRKRDICLVGSFPKLNTEKVENFEPA
jgi:hypothetical protein